MPAEGAEMHAPRSTSLTSDLPDIAADILARMRDAQTARPLHHQRGGAGVHRQRAAGRRGGPVDDGRARGDRRVRRPRRRPAGQSRHARPRAARGGRDRRSRRRPTSGARGCSIRSSSTARSRAPPLPRRWSRESRGPCASMVRNSPRLAGVAPTDDALRLYAIDQLCVVALTGATDIVTDGARSPRSTTAIR